MSHHPEDAPQLPETPEHHGATDRTPEPPAASEPNSSAKNAAMPDAGASPEQPLSASSAPASAAASAAPNQDEADAAPATRRANRTVASSNTGSVTDLDSGDYYGDHASLTATAGVPRDAAANAKGNKYGMPRFLVVTVGLAAVAIILLFVQGMQDIVAPIFLGLNLMIVVYPVQRFLSRMMPRVIATIIALIMVLAVLVGFIWSCVWALVELVNALPQYNHQFMALWKNISDLAVQLGFSPDAVSKAISEVKPNDVMGLIMPLLTNVSSVASLLATLIMATFFLSMDSSTIGPRLKLLRIVQPRALLVVSDFSVGVRRYWLVTTVFGLIVAFADVAALSMIGVPLVWVWGVLSFITNYIPNIGFVIGVVPPALLALLDGGWVQALIVLAVYCVLNFVIQVVIQPKFTGESVGVTPMVSFFSLLFWVWILGPLGALLALPATLLVKAFLIDSDPNARWLNLFVASSPDSALPDDEQPQPRNPRKARKVRERIALLRG